MDFLSSFSSITDWIIAHGYFFIFLIMCVEGPLTTAAAGFASALGYFDPWMIFFIAVMGDLIPDSIYYFIGYIGRFSVIERLGHKMGLTHERIIKLEGLLERHFGKTMITLKLTPVITVVGFMLVGYLKRPFAKFTGYSALITVPTVAIFLSLGYFFGHLYDINRYIGYAEIILPSIALIMILSFFGYSRISKFIAGKTGNL